MDSLVWKCNVDGKCDVSKACYRQPACLHLIMKWEINYTKTGILTLKLCDRINQTVFALFTSCLFSILELFFTQQDGKQLVETFRPEK